MNLTNEQKEKLENLIYILSIPILTIISIIIENNF